MELVRHYGGLNRPAGPAVSVCIANYQGEALLADCLESVFSQDCPGGLEVIVHDDASTDGSVELLRTHFPQVVVLASKENAGFAAANNRMVELARGRYVLILNNDAALHAGALQALLDAAAQMPLAIHTLPQFDWESGVLVDRGCLLDPFYNPVPNLDQRRSDVAMGIGACLFMARSLWHQLGGLPEWMGSLAEDVFICCLARLLGHPVRVTGTSGYRHRQGHSFGGNRPRSGRLDTTTRRRALSERNKTAALVVLTPGPIMWPLLGLHLFLLAAEGVALTALLRTTTPWRLIYAPAIGSIFERRGSLAELRRQAQTRRNTSIAGFFSTTWWWPRKLSLLGRYGLPRIR